MRSWTVAVALGVQLCAALAAEADAQVPVPPIGRVVDTTGTLRPGQRAELDRKLADAERSQGSRIFVVLVPTTKPDSIETFAFRVEDAWQVNRRGTDDIVLLLIALNDKFVRIETGTPLEAVISTDTAAQIITEHIVPFFKDGDIYGGIQAGIDRLIARIAARKPSAPNVLVAVLDLESVGATPAEASAASDRLREELLASGRFTLVNRDQIDALLKEQALQQTGCTSSECAVQVGKILGVRKIVAGRLNHVNADTWLLSAILVDVESARTERAASVTHEGRFVSLLEKGVSQLASKFVAR